MMSAGPIGTSSGTSGRDQRIACSQRTELATLVELCGNEPGVSAFEAESLNVSLQGIHLKADFIPDQGTSMVCRFESEGKEVVAEGVVAWRAASAGAGQFGLRFTSLEPKSAEALRVLCGTDCPLSLGGSGLDSVAESPGAPVRLHLEGLDVPMRARIRRPSTQGLQVRSSLQFLKLGRALQLESLENGVSQPAAIEKVEVVVDPETQIPQLVLSLRDPSNLTKPDEWSSSSAGNVGIDEVEEGEDDDLETSENAMDSVAMRRVRAMLVLGSREMARRLTQVGLFTMAWGRTVWAWSLEQSARGAVWVRSRRPGARTRSRRGPERGTRVQSTVRPAQILPGGNRRRFTQNKAKWRLDRRGKFLLAALAGLGIVLAVIFTQMRGNLPEGEKLSQGPDGGASADYDVATLGAQQKPPQELIANVPLFGSLPIATLGAQPGAPVELDAQGKAQEQKERKLAVTLAPKDQSWRTTLTRPRDVKPWGRGKMRLPTIHRMRLSAPGQALKGERLPNGFAIIVPDRKLMESGAGISRRDSRLRQVKVSRVGSSSKVSFRFRGRVPAYRVRLRKEFLEILISAPDASGGRP